VEAVQVKHSQVEITLRETSHHHSGTRGLSMLNRDSFEMATLKLCAASASSADFWASSIKEAHEANKPAAERFVRDGDAAQSKELVAAARISAPMTTNPMSRIPSPSLDQMV
jgi:hypothetical protein